MTKTAFFSREESLNVLMKRVGDLKYGYRQNLAILGHEQVGKTSIIFNFLKLFHDPLTVILYLDIKPVPFDIFAKKIIGVLLYNFLTNSGIPLKEDLNYLINKSEKFIPRTTEKIKDIIVSLNKKKYDSASLFAEALKLCDTIYEETSKHCVVIFDEFQHLENMGIKNLYREWTKLLITQKNTMYIIISSLKFKAENILAKNLSLLFGNFEQLLVEPFDIMVSEMYLEYKTGQHDRLTRGVKNFIIQLTGGYPPYLEIISNELLQTGQNRTLDDVLESILFDESGILNQRFLNILNGFSETPYTNDYISILHEISNGHSKIKELAHILHKTQKELLLRVNRTLEQGILSRSADFLKINDSLFAFWLKYVHQKKLHSLAFDAKHQKEIFRQGIDTAINELNIHTQRPLLERMTELLGMFEDEVIQIEKKKFRLTQFREIKPLEFNHKTIKEGLLGRSSDSVWIMALKYDLLTEEDISEFAHECKKYRHKLQRKIIVTLQNADVNARLRAMEEEILTWDLNNINRILDFFARPKILLWK